MSTENCNKTEPCSCSTEGGGGGGWRPTRRDFLVGLGVVLNVAAGAMISLPIIGYVLSSFVKKYPLQYVPVGKLNKFPEGTTRLATYINPGGQSWDGKTTEIPCWVRHVKDNEFQIFAINCTHLGCPVRWFEESKLFMCPCHGGAYYEDGVNAAGPPPRPLYTYKYQVKGDELQILAGVLPNLGNPDV